MTVTGGYVRHRDRMVQESVYQDLKDTLIACRWMAGTTSRPVYDPNDPMSGPTTLTVATNQVLPLAQSSPIVLIDYFPEAEGESFKTEPNTLALDNGTQGEQRLVELGSMSVEQSYVFTMAFWATSDAVALAVYNDLRDRYSGRIVRNETIQLWDFNSNASDPVAYMEVDQFRYSQNVDAVAPAEVHLYFGELTITDLVD